MYSLMTISDGLKERDGAGLPSEIIVALGKCRAKAFECFGRDRFEVRTVPPMGEEQ